LSLLQFENEFVGQNVREYINRRNSYIDKAVSPMKAAPDGGGLGTMVEKVL